MKARCTRATGGALLPVIARCNAAGELTQGNDAITDHMTHVPSPGRFSLVTGLPAVRQAADTGITEFSFRDVATTFRGHHGEPVAIRE